ncbi:DUF5691 domain-containing protein [Hymenobacter sp. CRA2]|uniref:DUF5691 domain-containing protein n=1 Tax=Hymenobacter sp. CRA2 TaxID=1955620 RepID=UPI00098FBFA2|nr:DUF5691 domain-containing protein [Hymenobacter sp. CRA2]OON69470.1 hypothetical protein B0919_09350 [Hymenobacter sp. CRA2]
MNPSADWPQLLRVALLGTRQSGEAVPSLPDLPATADAVREAQVLRAAGALGLMRKAGFQAPAATVTPPAPAAAESQPALGPQGADLLQQLLDGASADLLPGYLRSLGERGRRVPHRLLPQLLAYASSHRPVQEAAARVLGERGRWLAALNPGWAPLLLAAAPDEAAWESGTLAQRQRFLAELRGHDAARARELLAAALPQEPAKNQALLLSTLATGLSAADAPLLEVYLGSKSKEVRQAVAPLLVRTPGNALVERLWQQATALLTLSGPPAALAVELPAAWDASWQAQGIEPKDSRFGGEKAAWLGQMLALLPPERWSAHWQLSPEQLLVLAATSEWVELLLTGWRQALLLHPSPAWLRAYLQFQLDHAPEPLQVLSAVAEKLGAAEAAQVLLGALPPEPRFSQAPARWESLMLAIPGPWPAALTRAALAIIANTLASSDHARYVFLFRSGHLTQLLRHMQLAVPPAQYELCTAALSALYDADSTPITQLLDALGFRHRLEQTLTEAPGPDN